MKKSIILEPLGLFGWNKIEPIVLAALASEYPMLLIGKHGCAKSYLLERLAEELNMNYRFYNASLINYDDLVGIPIPSDDYKELNYISNKQSIWDAEIVFMDEINRCKVDLQNKLFPIIYDKRIQGIDLDKLKYRWAAMNPPADIDEDYTGTIELDKALADRFPFIIKVPEYKELTDKEKEMMIDDINLGKHKLDTDLYSLIQKVKDSIPNVKEELSVIGKNYVICLASLLQNKYKYISARRVSYLYETLLYIYASYKVLDNDITFNDVVYEHIKYVLPVRCSESLDEVDLSNIVSETLSITNLDQKDLFLMEPGVKKLIKLINFYPDIDETRLNEIVGTSISSIKDIKERRIISLFTFNKLRNNSKIHASTMELLYSLCKVFYNTLSETKLVDIKDKRIKDRADTLLLKEKNKVYYDTLNNVVNYFSINKDEKFIDELEIEKTIDFFKYCYKEIIEDEFI